MIFGWATKSEMEVAINAAKLEVLVTCAKLAASDVKLAEQLQKLAESDRRILELYQETLDAMRAVI